jgi:hypothetical protein
LKEDIELTPLESVEPDDEALGVEIEIALEEGRDLRIL